MEYQCENCGNRVRAKKRDNPNRGTYYVVKCNCGAGGSGHGGCIDGVHRWDEIEGFVKLTRRYGEPG